MSTGNRAAPSATENAVLTHSFTDPGEDATKCVVLNAVILCVDDDTYSLELLSSWLTSEGFDVVTLSSAEQALERIWERLPDLLIVDPMMVDGAGLQLCKQVRAHPETRHIPVILHTAASSSLPEEGVGNCVCTKPPDRNALIDAVRTLLMSRP